MTADGQGTDWARWLRRWDAQQEGYVPDREARFTIMLDALEAVLPPSFVALSATALHWLSPGSLIRVYHDLAGLLRPGGLFLNADHLPYATPTFARLSGQVLDAQWSAAAFAARGIETAEQWWSDFAADPAHASLMAAQARRFAGKERPTVRPGAEVHAAALREVGFAEVDTLWQVLSDQVLMAVR